MQLHEAGGRRLSSTGRVGTGLERKGLQAICRHQAHVIEALGEAVSVLRSGAAALKAENADLRAANERVRDGGRAHASSRTGAREALEAPLGLDARAPAAARSVVADCLRGRVAASALANAQLVMSELVTNSVCHSAAAADATVRVRLTGTMIRLEVEDRGRGGVIAPRSPDLESGGGFGLNIVQALSERWGLERVVAGGTRVWAQLPRAPLVVPVPAESSDVRGARSSPNGTLTSGRAAAARRREPTEGTP
jgi:anti-sigma regulatory factor (Ser/Thr protein kinase)